MYSYFNIGFGLKKNITTIFFDTDGALGTRIEA